MPDIINTIIPVVLKSTDPHHPVVDGNTGHRVLNYLVELSVISPDKREEYTPRVLVSVTYAPGKTLSQPLMRTMSSSPVIAPNRITKRFLRQRIHGKIGREMMESVLASQARQHVDTIAPETV